MYTLASIFLPPKPPLFFTFFLQLLSSTSSFSNAFLLSPTLTTSLHHHLHHNPQKMEKLLLTPHHQDQQQQQQDLLNLKVATELRLGLPGSESPPEKTIIKKRGFSDTINIAPSATWVFSENGGGGSEVKNGAFFTSSSSSSPRCCENNKNPINSSSAINKESIGVSSSSAKGSPASSNQHSLKSQVVGWPPIRSFRKNSMATKNTKSEDDPNAEMGTNCVYVKVSMDGAPYLRKIDLKIYSSYLDLSKALEKMFSSFTLGQKGEGLTESPFMALLNGSEYVLTYEDKDGDLMLVGDVPWEMFIGSCKRMRIMKSSDAIGLAPRAMEKRKGHD